MSELKPLPIPMFISLSMTGSLTWPASTCRPQVYCCFSARATWGPPKEASSIWLKQYQA
jgi:hypothetical protein